MAKDRDIHAQYVRPVRRILVGMLVFFLLAIFLIWRIDSPRVEHFRASIVDKVVPNFEWAMVPVTAVVGMFEDLASYKNVYDQNQELRRELQRLKSWKEAAVQMEQQNAKLLALNSVRLDPKLTSVSGVVLADSGSPFRQSVLLNVGLRDGIKDGWATMDGIGLVGRISGVGNNTARVILLTDSSSRIPVTIQPAVIELAQVSGQNAMLVGDNSANPPIEFLDKPELVKAGDRVVTSGDGGLFPSDLLVGRVARDSKGRLRVRLAADYGRMDFLRVLRSRAHEVITETGALMVGEPSNEPATLPPEIPPPSLVAPMIPDPEDARPSHRPVDQEADDG